MPHPLTLRANIGDCVKVKLTNRLESGNASIHVNNIAFDPMDSQGIIVGNNVWVGANCSILSGAVIGKDSVIGAGCVISRSIPENSVVVSGSRKLSIIERR